MEEVGSLVRRSVLATHHPHAILTQHLLSVCTLDVTSTVMTHWHIHHVCYTARCLVRVRTKVAHRTQSRYTANTLSLSSSVPTVALIKDVLSRLVVSRRPLILYSGQYWQRFADSMTQVPSSLSTWMSGTWVKPQYLLQTFDLITVAIRSVNLELQPSKVQIWKASCQDPIPGELQDKVRLTPSCPGRASSNSRRH